MVRVFQIVAVVLVGLTAYFLWTYGVGDHAFVSGVAAIAAGFLSYRARLKARNTLREEQAERLE